jgi:sugar O-acyltransferase (sialic acid O-acetyltransferase NeuD family)
VKLLIAGAGGHGRVIADTAADSGVWSEIAFLDDGSPDAMQPSAWPVVGRLRDLQRLASQYDACIAGFGDGRLRLEVLGQAQMAGLNLPVLVHRRASVSPRARLEGGVVVFAGTVVNIGAKLDRGCIVNTGATVDHDCQLAEGVHICPGAHLAGNVKVGARTWFGIGAVAIQGISIGTDVTVGAGAVCIADVRDGVTVFGVPAREK